MYFLVWGVLKIGFGRGRFVVGKMGGELLHGIFGFELKGNKVVGCLGHLGCFGC